MSDLVNELMEIEILLLNPYPKTHSPFLHLVLRNDYPELKNVKPIIQKIRECHFEYYNIAIELNKKNSTFSLFDQGCEEKRLSKERNRLRNTIRCLESLITMLRYEV